MFAPRSNLDDGQLTSDAAIDARRRQFDAIAKEVSQHYDPVVDGLVLAGAMNVQLDESLLLKDMEQMRHGCHHEIKDDDGAVVKLQYIAGAEVNGVILFT